MSKRLLLAFGAGVLLLIAVLQAFRQSPSQPIETGSARAPETADHKPPEAPAGPGPATPLAEESAPMPTAATKPFTMRGQVSPAVREIESIIADPQLENAEAAKRLLTIARNSEMPDAVRRAALGHAFHLTPSESYLATLGSLLDVDMTAEVFEPAWADLFERDTPLQLEAAWRIATKQGHTHQESANEFIRSIIGPQENPDPKTWRSAITTYLAAHPGN